MQDFGYEFLRALGMTEVPVVHIMMTSPASWLSTQFCLHSAMLAWVLAVALLFPSFGLAAARLAGLISKMNLATFGGNGYRKSWLASRS